jgi:hypothetical protein
VPELVGVLDAVVGRRKLPIAIRQRIQQTAVPRLAGCERHLEADPAVGVDGFRGAVGIDRQGAREVGVAVGCAKALLRSQPFGRDTPAAPDTARLDLEDIGEVGAQHDLQLETHRLHGVVCDLQVLVHAAGNGPTHDEAKRAGGNGPVLRQNGAIGEVDLGGIVADGAAIQEIPRHSVGIDRPAAENARVEEEEAAIARPVDLGIELGHKDCLAVVNGNLRRTHFNFERHGFAWPPSVRSASYGNCSYQQESSVKAADTRLFLR